MAYQRNMRMDQINVHERWNEERQDYKERDAKPTTYYRSRKNRNENSSRRSYKDEGDYSRQRITVRVPASKVGRVIGKQGAKIRELQSTTGTRIHVGKEEDDGRVKISITGSFEGGLKCKEMILKLTEESALQRLRMETEVEKNKNESSLCYIDWDTVSKLNDEYEKQKWAHLNPIKKNFYVEAPEVAYMTEGYVSKLRKSLNNITIENVCEPTSAIPNPVETFDQAFAPYPELLDLLKKQKFTKPFPIQCQAWPVLLSGRDMIGIAQTGTGKTLAFLLPALIHTVGQEMPILERGGPNVLILAPTRELALQIDGEAKKFHYHDLKSVCLYGGGERDGQIKELERGVQIIIATPGRLNDLITAGAVNMESVTFLVLDEADRMLEMGFERQIRRIMLTVRPDRQTVMTSATWPYMIQNLAGKYMKEPLKVVIGSTDLTAVHSVQQNVHIVKEEGKFEALLSVISDLKPNDKIIVFVGKRAVADSLACDLTLRNIACQSIHGSREQSDREQAIDDLKNGVVRILVATDVASRGLDIVDITKVINYDFPRNIEEYVHRVGRTGRAGKTGEAVSFFTMQDRTHAKELIKILEEANQFVPDELRTICEENEAIQERLRSERGYGRGRTFAFGKRTWDDPEDW